LYLKDELCQYKAIMTNNDSSAEKSLPKHGGKPFVKGYDPRRNLRGTPKDAITARKLMRKIAAELLQLPNGGGEITRVEAMLTAMFSSKAPADRQNILKALWPGLLKDEVDITSEGKAITFIVKREDGKDDNTSPQAI
jgi:hypothetical protein